MGIYTKVPDPAGDKWVQIGAELPGIGGWATIINVSGTYEKYTYNDGVTDWVAYEWYDWTSKNAEQTGTITTSGGIVDCLVVSSGVAHNYAACAPVTDAEFVFPAGLLNLSMGYALGGSVDGSYSDTRITPDGTIDLQRQIVINSGYTAYFDGNVGRSPNGQYSSITGTEVLYGHCPDSWPAGANPPGWGGISGNNTPGAVIVRVPAANADGVAENFHGWDSFALVTDGVVTEVTKVPDNEPRTLDAEWVPCSADVQAGWSQVDGEFVPPPAPTRDDLIAELQAQVEELRKA